MSTYQAVSLMIMFGVLLISLISLIIAILKAILGSKK